MKRKFRVIMRIQLDGNRLRIRVHSEGGLSY